MRYVLKSKRGRGGFLTLEEKIHALADMHHDGKSASAIVSELYSSKNRSIPGKPSQVVGSWRQSIKAKLAEEEALNEDDRKYTNLLKAEEMLEEATEGQEVIRSRRRK